jgi:hypothetical protein
MGKKFPNQKNGNMASLLEPFNIYSEDGLIAYEKKRIVTLKANRQNKYLNEMVPHE